MKVRHAMSVVALALAGCASVSVTADYDRSVTFGGLHTYSWRPITKAPTGDPRFDSPQLDAQIRSAVDRVLASKGYHPVASGTTPDFMVGYHAAVRQKTSSQTVDRWYGEGIGGWGGWPETYTTYTYDEGVLLIDILDPATMKVWWRARATAVVDPRARPAKRTERINDAVDRMLAGFPP